MTTWSDQRKAALLLHLVPGLGPRTQENLREHVGAPHQVLEASWEQLIRVPGIGSKTARRIVSADLQQVDAELEICRQCNVDIMLRGDDNYPTMLGCIPDPPGALFARGRCIEDDALSVAIVGSRHATSYGLQHAERLGRALANAGLTVVSGLARGVDAAAHRGALSAPKGRTLAVLASGVQRVYPPEHKELADQIAANGALLSEAPPLRKPMSGAFPQRNRLISGLSLGTIVVEAAERSGALITVRHAAEQGREVFALPGRVDSRMSRGCHQLLRDGAKLVEHVDDVLEELCPLAVPVMKEDGQVRHPRELKLDEQERKVLSGIQDQPTNVDAVALACGLPMPQVLATISVLETRRLVQRLSGALVARL